MFWFAPPFFPPSFFAPPGFKGKCLSPDSVIFTNTGWVKAKDIKPGDNIITINGNNIDIESVTLNKTSKPLPTNVEFSNSQVVSVETKLSTLIGFNYRGKDYSITQPIFVKTSEGITYKNAGEIKVGDAIISVDSQGEISEIIVDSIQIDDLESTVYDIRTSPEPWFIVNSTIAIA
jgi:hypothetical protein